MPLLSIVVPAYNAADHLHRALVPLLRMRHDIEVIVVDDGSTDATAEIADDYARRRPDVFRAIHQPNRGHGGAINTGLAEARGTYLKVLDADDWLSIPALEQVLQILRTLEECGGVDAVFTDYVHDRVGKSNRVSRFDSVFPAGRVFEWGDTERFSRRQYLMMHAIIYRTEMVRASGLRLPENTFYVDNLYVVVPLARVRSMYYLPGKLYHYVIGREGQSVEADTMLRRVDQQLRVNRLALRALPSPAEVATGEVPAPLYAALLHYIEAICAVTSATLARGGTRAHLAQRDAFWREVKAESPWVYTRLRRSFMGASSNLPGHAGRRVTSLAYSVARRVVGFS
ncbi:glycosyltransferase family A protein [Microbacterium barkeri]|uniref:glycosyltransferase family 2 protein n=1 Tax=Microbacterium barkeri TaxID=33917 RepID=UPI0024AFF94B|nr:glycosyltransferase family A protein [Microbacterium barkeri]MDI6944680.1 glycosyltransferase family A protein [Microbacterium barkeri]